MRTNIPFVVMSAERREYDPPVNEWRTASLRHQLEARDLTIVPVDGVYQGHHERSFVVFLPPDHAAYTLTMLRQLGKRWGQESILYVDANRGAELLYLDGRAPIDLGIWQNVSKADAWAEEGYTYQPELDAYYVARRAS